MTKTLIVSFDCELDGTNPLQHSMRSLGVAVFEEGKSKHIATFYVNLKPQQHAISHEKTMREFWAKREDQWTQVCTNQQDIPQAMAQFSDFLKQFGNATLIYICSPVSVDWMFLKSYYEAYGPSNKFDIGFYCHDLSVIMRTYMLLNKIPKDGEDKFKRDLAEDQPYTHHALQDAIYQGVSYINLRLLIGFENKK